MKHCLLSLTFVCCLLLCTVVNATPYVTNVVAKQRYPWNGLVDVSYEVVGSTNGIDLAYGHLKAIDQKTQKSYSASTFTKPIELTEGTHTAIWNMSADHAVASKAMDFPFVNSDAAALSYHRRVRRFGGNLLPCSGDECDS